ncbi:DUF2306 domain-containing protein [Danxiaibacter flavus]|uniref:DUF2306 domain-containing protein n=1 Tax=Danxiaibacter flavus TaxID=3049108 RepID=A0ABV3ZL07_9BACT|nr:DUF2306 domain-containing protein [Chitinophagaceae bacterium DXS]
MTLRISKIAIAILATIVSLYPVAYFIFGTRFGLLRSKSDTLLLSALYNVGFYIHIVGGGIALLTGWPQFNRRLRLTRMQIHRMLGKIYVTCVLLSSLAGIYIATYATGGMIASSGFMSLGAIWFTTTLIAYTSVRSGNINLHQKMMIYSYAACFAAVTLRIYLPLLTMLFHDFIKAYLFVAWLCWVPNIIMAYFIAKKAQPWVLQQPAVQTL